MKEITTGLGGGQIFNHSITIKSRDNDKFDNPATINRQEQ